MTSLFINISNHPIDKWKDKDTGFDYWASISDEIRSQPEINTEVVSAERR